MIAVENVTTPTFTPDVVGTKIVPRQCEVTARHAQNFAAAIGDANFRYFDDECADGLLAPPLLAVALTTPLTKSLREEDTGLMQASAFAKPLHFTERLLFHRPLRPGMLLSIGAQVSALRSHPKGALLTLSYRATSCDVLIFTEDIALLLRDVAVVGAEFYEATQRPRNNDTVLWSETIAIDPMLPYVYDACSNIVNLIHTSPKAAHAAGLPGVILQGTATLALAMRHIVDREAQGDVMRLREVFVRFAAPVIPSTTIDVVLTGRHKEGATTTLNFHVAGADHRALLSDGMARFAPCEE